MNLNITEEERKLLLELFQATEKELIAGIDHADARDYKKKAARSARSSGETKNQASI